MNETATRPARRSARLAALLLVAFLRGHAFADGAAAPDEDEGGIVEEVTAGVEELGDDVRDQYEWLRRRRTFTIEEVPYGATGLPLVFYTPSSGLTYGGWVQLANYKRPPYKYRVMVQWWLTTEGKRNHFIRGEIPTFWGTPFSLRVLMRDVNRVSANFFGLGNDSVRDTDITDENEYYYQYRLEEQRTAFDVEGEFPGGQIGAFYGLRFNRGLPTRRRADEDSYVFDHADEVDRPIDPYDRDDGRWRNFVAVGVLGDTRDDKEFTTEGTLADASVQWAPSILGSDYDYTRLTVIGRKYWRLVPRHDPHTYVIFARVIAETIWGDAPFYALTEVGGAIRGKSGGGTGSLRGYSSRRFADRTKVLANAEVRRFLKRRRIRRQNLETQVILFGDYGRVAPSLSKWRPDDAHTSGGAGVLVNWNAQLTLRLDWAVSPEGDAVLFTFGQIF